MVMSLAEFLERLEADPFDPKLFELVKDGFNVVSGKSEPQNHLHLPLKGLNHEHT